MCDRSSDPAIVKSIIYLSDVTVTYQLPKQIIRSFKEYAIHRLKAGRYDYEKFRALNQVDFHVKAGQTVGIIGRNGAGKSTLLKVIAGIIKPRLGTVSVKGRIAPLIELGAGFDPELTGRENVYLNGALLGMTNRALGEKLPGIIEFAELADFIDAPLRTYSSGMIARLGFAVATDVEPDILIVDEILGVGDDAFQKKCKKRLDKFRDNGVTVLVVSHDMEQIRSMCHKVYWLDRGQVMACGISSDIVGGYQGFSCQTLEGTSGIVC